MKIHTSAFKEQIKTLGRELKVIISYNDIVLEEELFFVNPHYEADILKSVMKELDIESSIDIPLETIINLQIGIKVNDNYEMLNYGNYVVFSSKKQEDTNTYNIKCYDKMIYSMKQNEELGITYPISIKNYLNAIGTKIGLNVSQKTFYNETLEIPAELYVGLEYTYRDILDEIAQATGSIICINENDEIEVKYLTQTNDTIDEEYLKDVNVDFGQMYGAINTIVLSRSGESDNIYYPSVLPENPVEIKIVDNQIMNGNNRSDYMPGIYNALNGLYYYINDYNSTGILYYDVGDLYNVTVGENTYQCLMLNDEIDIGSGIVETIHTDMPEKSQTDYTKADKTDRRINQTYLIVDKQNQTIESVVSQIGDRSQKTTTITQDIDGVNSRVDNILILTNTVEATGRAVLPNAATTTIDELIITGEIAVDRFRDDAYGNYNLAPALDLAPTSTLTPVRAQQKSEALYFGDTTILKDTNLIHVKPNETTEEIVMPDFILRQKNAVQDELVISDGTIKIIRKIGVDEAGYRYILPTPIEEDLGEIQINLEEGTNEIYMKCFNNAHFKITYVTKNDLTKNFATKVEMQSEISQSASEINLEVDEKLTSYSTTEQMNSAINIKAGEITSTVSQTYETKQNAQSNYSSINQRADGIETTVSQKVGNNEVISKINQSAEQIQIQADKIDIDGKAVHFKTNISVTVGPYTSDDRTKLINYLLGTGTLTPEEIQRYDITGDGSLNSADVLLMTRAINNGGYYTFSGYYEIDPYSYNKSLRIYNSTRNKFSAIFSLIYNYIDYLYCEGANIKGQLIVENERGQMFTQLNNDDTRFELYTDGDIRADHKITCETLTQTSREENKKNFEKLQNGLNIIQSTDIYKYNMKSQEDGDKKHIGFVIGDKYKYSEEITSEGNDGVDTYSMISVAYKAIQELAEQNEQLQKEIQELKGEKENGKD